MNIDLAKFYKIQVVGTNGKGSTCAFLESILYETGYKVGATFSPHLVEPTERIRINKKEMDKNSFIELCNIVKKTVEMAFNFGRFNYYPTFFEHVTAMALLAFDREGVDFAVLETGLGGRFDAVTAANADIIAFTPISYDHEAILGETLEKITCEKGAVLREKVFAISTTQLPQVKNVLDEIACRKGAVLIYDDYVTVIGEDYVSFRSKKYEINHVKLGLNGKHQISNARLALAVCDYLKPSLISEKIKLGLENVNHPGRLQLIENFLLDGAHNPAGAKVLSDFLVEHNAKNLIAILAVMKSKNWREILKLILPFCSEVIFPKMGENFVEPEELADFASQESSLSYSLAPDTKSAITLAKNLSTKVQSKFLLVTGSLYLVGHAIKILKETHSD